VHSTGCIKSIKEMFINLNLTHAKHNLQHIMVYKPLSYIQLIPYEKYKIRRLQKHLQKNADFTVTYYFSISVCPVV